MKVTFVTALLLVLSGCGAGMAKIYLPDGTQGYRVTCGGAVRSMGTCYEEAGKICGERGYVDLGNSQESTPANLGNGPFLITSRELLFRCN